ncbi:MAG TPA: hypothetical protein VGB82_12145 [Alphaproteobacteria bacterium]
MTTINTSNPQEAILLASNNANDAVLKAIAEGQAATVITAAPPKAADVAAPQGVRSNGRKVRTKTLEDGTVATYR